MQERNTSIYHIEQFDNTDYLLSTSLINNKLKLSCQDSLSQIYKRTLSLVDLNDISQYFNSISSIEQVQAYLNGIIESQRVEISQDDSGVKVILHLINNDNIVITLTDKSDVSSSFTNIQIQYLDMSPRSNYDNIDYYKNPRMNNAISENYISEQNLNEMMYSSRTFSEPKSPLINYDIKTYNKTSEMKKEKSSVPSDTIKKKRR